MTSPFISIVTISFNQGPYLRQCVDSVLAQKCDDVEYIIVDPGSTDGSREILASYGAAIDHLVLEPDNGPADGLSKGFARATGEVGYFINSDDFLLPSAVDRMRRLWAANPGIDLLLGGAWMVDGAGAPIRELVASSAELDVLLSGDSHIVQQGLSFRMDRLREVGGFNVANRTCWDFEFICAMLRNGARARVCRERIGTFRMYEGSLSGGVAGSVHIQRYRDDLDRIHREFTGGAFEWKGPLVEAMARARRGLSHPAITLSLIQDRLFSKRICRRFERDMTMSGTGRC
jgi:glycosyltransferase involved in cell wall biosynthesis